MTVPATEAAATDTPEPTAPDSDSSQESSTTPAPADKDWEAEAAKWKALSRKHENANTQTLKELEQLRAAQMTDSEKAVAEAEKRGREAALKELRADMARMKLQSQAAGKVADVDALLDLVDINRLITEDGIDEEAIAATIERLTKVIPAPAQPKFDNVELGPQGNRPRQLTRDEIRTMTPDQIEDARLKGQLDSLLGITP